ncbi:T9SS type A sorting domain-containing protein [Siansivirga zeaxanthinifaciens]|uniref:Secretion system C-terminal sorting domain-containing protein n=1 Tax=Siansivirga zeaxanthinifaciens CC-SAMT-1 TaxID=1454006 RepID=A0A0C5WD32_9FLAO|nr:T9SS type A sorting domain-containing protein [Siansivirga zeaxanthinifaciens]AJR04983.1 hypothetical protein AW14_13620 [Siansivirga zeaxanthinifaciens CC-SAMT-1]
MKITNGQGGGGAGAEGVYELVNVATGKYLGAASSAQPVVMHDVGEGIDRKWVFVKTNVDGVDYYNIDSQDSGILRATGGSFAAGAYLVVSTTKEAPAIDTDKLWTVHYNNTDDTFRFEAKNSGRFLYHQTDGNCYNLIEIDDFEENDPRSKWQVFGSGGPLLSVKNNNLKITSIKIYPNPAKDSFTITFDNFTNAKVLIYDILGKVMFENSTKTGRMEVKNNVKLNSGMYLVKILADGNKVYHKKLVIK